MTVSQIVLFMFNAVPIFHLYIAVYNPSLCYLASEMIVTEIQIQIRRSSSGGLTNVSHVLQIHVLRNFDL